MTSLEQIGGGEFDPAKGIVTVTERLPYVEGEVVVFQITSSRFDDDRVPFVLYRTFKIETVDFIALSHLWAGSSARDEDKVGAPEENLAWKVHQSSYTRPQFYATLRAIHARNNTALIWIDYVSLPQTLMPNRAPGVMTAMSKVYTCCSSCVAIPLCDLSFWEGNQESLRKSLREADKDMRGENWTRQVSDEACDEMYAADLKRVVDRVRPSNISAEGWTGMGYIPYKYMRDVVLVLNIAHSVFLSGYFARVWTFQELLLPEVIDISFGLRSGTQHSNLMDIDAFMSLTDNAVNLHNKLYRALSNAGARSAAWNAYSASVTLLHTQLSKTKAWINRGRDLGRQSRRRIHNNEWDSGYVENVFQVFCACPRAAQEKQDYVFGILGIIPLNLPYVEDLGQAIKMFTREISKKTRRVWTAGGFIKAFDSEMTWWTGTVPKTVYDSEFLKNISYIADLGPNNMVSKEIGTKIEMENIRTKGRVSLTVRRADEIKSDDPSYNEKKFGLSSKTLLRGPSVHKYPLRHDPCPMHQQSLESKLTTEEKEVNKIVNPQLMSKTGSGSSSRPGTPAGRPSRPGTPVSGGTPRPGTPASGGTPRPGLPPATTQQSEQVHPTELTRFLHSLMLRCGINQLKDAAFVSYAKVALRMGKELEHGGASVPYIREEMFNYLTNKDPEKMLSVLDFIPSGTSDCVNMHISDMELINLMNLDNTPRPIVVTIHSECGCRFGLPHALFQRFCEIFWPRKLQSMLNVSCIDEKTERLDVIACVAEIPHYALRDVVSESTYKNHFDMSKPDLILAKYPNLAKALQDVSRNVPVDGYLLSLRDKTDKTRSLPSKYVQLYESGQGSYFARGSDSKDSLIYWPIGILVMESEELEGLKIRRLLVQSSSSEKKTDGLSAGTYKAPAKQPDTQPDANGNQGQVDRGNPGQGVPGNNNNNNNNLNNNNSNEAKPNAAVNWNRQRQPPPPQQQQQQQQPPPPPQQHNLPIPRRTTTLQQAILNLNSNIERNKQEDEKEE